MVARATLLSTFLMLTALPAAAQSNGRTLTSPAERSADETAVPPAPGAPAESTSGLRYPSATNAARIRLTPEVEPTVRLSSRTMTRIRSLDAGLRQLSNQGNGNVVSAVLALVTGGLSITLGAVKVPNDDLLSAYLYVYGGSAAARGAVELLLAPNAMDTAIRYQHMPMRNAEEVEQRLRYGESSLASLAERALIRRVLDASLSMAAGVAVVPIYLAPNDFEVGNPLDSFVLIGAGVSVVTGIISLATPSAAEQRWSAYQALRRRLADAPEPDGAEAEDVPATSADNVSWRVGGGPTRGGLFASLALSY